MQDDAKKVIGRAENVTFPELDLEKIAARIDTGAKTSTIWADAHLEGEKLAVHFFGPTSSHYTGQPVYFEEFDAIAVASSTGQIQKRYKIRLLVKIKGKKIRSWFTLADRSSQVYPVLIGRNVLSGKFIVDVKKGHVLRVEEQRRTESLQAYLEDNKKKDL